MSTDDSISVISRCHQAFARGDTGSIVSALHPDVEWSIPETLPYGGVYHGRDGVEGFYRALGRWWSDYELQVDRILGSGEVVVSVGKMRGRAAAEFVAPFALVWEFEDGRVRRMRQHADTAAMLTAIGNAPG